MAGEIKVNGGGTSPRRAGGRIEVGGAAESAPAPASPPATEATSARTSSEPAEPSPGFTSPPPAETPEPNRQSTARDRARASDYTPHYKESERRPADQRENAFQAVAWLLEGVTGVVEELRHSDLGLSEEFWVHAYAARRESLLALRSLVNQMLDKVEAADRQEEERRQRRERRGGINISE